MTKTELRELIREEIQRLTENRDTEEVISWFLYDENLKNLGLDTSNGRELKKVWKKYALNSKINIAKVNWDEVYDMLTYRS